MSSLQKFHRRTQVSSGGVVPEVWPATSIGQGDVTHGYWLGTAGDGTSKLIVAPKSTETQQSWGSRGTVRNTISSTDGVVNTTTLFGFGSTAHPAAYYCKTLTYGGYNTWYLPAKDELTTMYSNKAATPFATANVFGGTYSYWNSTESSANFAGYMDFTTGSFGGASKTSTYYVRATRRSAI